MKLRQQNKILNICCIRLYSLNPTVVHSPTINCTSWVGIMGSCTIRKNLRISLWSRFLLLLLGIVNMLTNVIAIINIYIITVITDIIII
jgi:hypothetical protein